MNDPADATGPTPVPVAKPPRHHLLIAGTGRSGTSFLVRFLAAMGLETHLAKSGDARWHEDANAGLEDLPLPAAFDDLPYVIKTPFLADIIDDVLRDPGLAIDAVIVPVRDLAEAAASRTVTQLQAIHQLQPWMSALDRMVENWGVTPGGTVFSLNPVDQGRLLAVGFHRLIERLTRAEVPMLFLDFPRLAQDPAYLFARLGSLLPAGSTIAQAEAAHAATADATKIRIGSELHGAPDAGDSVAHTGPAYPDINRLNRIALRRELVRLQAAQASGAASSLRQQESIGARERELKELGARERAMGERETAMAQREQTLARRADEVSRQADALVREVAQAAGSGALRSARSGRPTWLWRAIARFRRV